MKKNTKGDIKTPNDPKDKFGDVIKYSMNIDLSKLINAVIENRNQINLKSEEIIALQKSIKTVADKNKELEIKLASHESNIGKSSVFILRSLRFKQEVISNLNEKVLRQDKQIDDLRDSMVNLADYRKFEENILVRINSLDAKNESLNAEFNKLEGKLGEMISLIFDEKLVKFRADTDKDLDLIK